MTYFEQLRSKTGRGLKRLFFPFGLFVLVFTVIFLRGHPKVQIQRNTTVKEKVVDDIDLFKLHRNSIQSITIANGKVEEEDNLFGIPGENNLENMDNNSLYLLFNRYIKHTQFLCNKISRKGHKGSFGKIICEDPVFKPRLQCLVYSFGSQFKFDFEDAIWKSFECEIHTFDPSLSTEGKIIPTYIDYHLIGLSGRNFDQTEPEIWRHHDNPLLKTWKMRTLATIMNSLNHSNKTIDILKIDIEGWEWDALPEMISSESLRNVKQLCLEVHFGFSFKNKKVKGKLLPTYTQNTWGNVPIKGQIKILKMLFAYGFRIVNNAPLGYTIMINNMTIKPLTELTLINLNFIS